MVDTGHLLRYPSRHGTPHDLGTWGKFETSQKVYRANLTHSQKRRKAGETPTFAWYTCWYNPGTPTGTPREVYQQVPALFRPEALREECASGSR